MFAGLSCVDEFYRVPLHVGLQGARDDLINREDDHVDKEGARQAGPNPFREMSRAVHVHDAPGRPPSGAVGSRGIGRKRLYGALSQACTYGLDAQPLQTYNCP